MNHIKTIDQQSFTKFLWKQRNFRLETYSTLLDFKCHNKIPSTIEISKTSMII